MGNPKLPNHLKLIRGTDRPNRMTRDDLQFPLAEGEVPAPDWLRPEAQDYWQHIVLVLQAKQVLTVADLGALEVMRALYGVVRRVVSAGTYPSPSVVAQLRLYQAESGLTPIGRTKLRQPTYGGQENPFDRNGKHPER